MPPYPSALGSAMLLISMATSDVIIIGGGIMGAGLALELAEADVKVTLLEKGEPGREASWAAAGMLAPAGEHQEHPALTELARASMALYPDWVKRIGDGDDLGYRSEGTFVAAFDEAEVNMLRAAGLELLSPTEARKQEPTLGERIIAAAFLPGDHQVDNRRLMTALVARCRSAGVEVRGGTRVRAVQSAAGRVVDVLPAEGAALSAGVVVNAAGCWSSQLGDAAPPARPVRGQVIALQAGAKAPRHVLRSRRAYLVPRGDGRVLVGSTMEDAGFNKSVTPGPLARLLAGARELAPALAAASFVEAWAGLRPDTPDHLPVLGATGIDGYFVATGHFRNGILLAPITAKLMSELILGRPTSLPLEPFSPLRFSSRRP